MNTPFSRKLPILLILAVLLLSSLACFNTITTESKPTSTAKIPAGVKCVVPDLAGIDQQTAVKSLTSLGLTPFKKVEFNTKVALDAVISTDPPAGTILQKCQGDIILLISLGAKPGATQTPVEVKASPTPTKVPALLTPTTAIADQIDQPMYKTIYKEGFDTPKNGFNPAWQVSYGAGGTSKANKGWLELNGIVNAVVGDKSWKDYVVTFHAVDGSLYSLDVFFRMQDPKNALLMSCEDIQSTVGIGSALHCQWFRVKDGAQEKVEGVIPDEVCVGMCDIVIEAAGSDFRFLFNSIEKFRFTAASNPAGMVGFKVKSTSAALRLFSFDISTPNHPASPGEILFRDDFKTGEWTVGSNEDEYAAYQQNLVNGKYQWKIKAKKGLSIKQCNPAMTLPDIFTLTAKVKAVSGPKDLRYALVFNCIDNSNLYYFSVSEDGYYGFFKLQDGQWETIINDTKITLSPGKQNTLQVVGGKGLYNLILNGKQLAQVNDAAFVNGGIGLAVELNNPGDQATIEFDDIQIDMP